VYRFVSLHRSPGRLELAKVLLGLQRRWMARGSCSRTWFKYWTCPWRNTKLPTIRRFDALDTIAGNARRLGRPGGLPRVVAESVLVWHQLEPPHSGQFGNSPWTGAT
jgi:hypothetical protein